MSDLIKKRSKIWHHFSVISKDKVKCEYCSKMISYSGGGTGNLTRHMKKLHGTVTIEQPISESSEVQISLPRSAESTATEVNGVPSTSSDLVPSQPSLCDNTATPTASTPRQTTQSRVQSKIINFGVSLKPLPISKTQQFDEQIVKFIVKGYHSFAIVEEEEFQNIYKLILPTYKLPARKTISSSLIPRLYQITKEKVLLQLQAEAEAICLTTDGWTSRNNTSFFALTAHYIDQNCMLKSFLVGCDEFDVDERHTAENLSNFLINSAETWGLSNKIAGIITDNAANIVAAVHLTTWRHFPCFAHTVNLVVQHSLNNIKEQLDRVKSIVQYFKHSSTAESKLAAMQTQMGLSPLKLKQSVVTRWNSTYDMLARLLKIKDAVISTLAIEQPRLNTLTLDDWIVIEKCVHILKIFYEVTVEMSAEKSVSMSKVIVLVKIMKTHVENCFAEDTHSAQPYQYVQLLMTLRDQLNTRFRDIEGNILAAQAAFLDPRFKKHAFTSKEKYENCLKAIKTKLRQLIAQENATPLTEQESRPQPSTSGNMWETFDKEVENEVIKNPTAACIVELDKYLNEPLIKRTEDPLKWWNERRLLYPNLYTLMKRRLCVTATSVPCERIFSKAGMTINDKRSCLKPNKASQILFLNHNLE